MHLKIITREGLKLSQEVENVILPAQLGQMQVLPSHAPTVVLLNRGRLLYDRSGLIIGGGVARIFNNEVLILAEGVESAVE